MKEITIRRARPEDAEECGRITYEAFKDIAGRHNFPPDFPSAYASAPSFWPLDHAAAEGEEDMKALLVGAAAATSGPLSLLPPTRRAGLFRWRLSRGPRGSFYPSVGY